MWDVCADLVLERETVCVYFKTEYVKYFQSYMHNKNLFKIFQFFKKNACTHIPEQKPWEANNFTIDHGSSALGWSWLVGSSRHGLSVLCPVRWSGARPPSALLLTPAVTTHNVISTVNVTQGESHPCHK